LSTWLALLTVDPTLFCWILCIALSSTDARRCNARARCPGIWNYQN
jgi:hypothetical protein